MPSGDLPKMGAEDWAGEMGAKWHAHLDQYESMIAGIGTTLIEDAAFSPGETVIDIGCGGGATSLMIAAHVAPGGRVLGVDIAPELVKAATARARKAQAPSLQFLCADAANLVLEEPPFDRLVSRFGVMFFTDPQAAFAHLRGFLKPAGRVDLAVWGPPRDNPWMMSVMNVVRAYLEVPSPAPRTPGPFALEDRAYLAELLEGAGFSDVCITPHPVRLPLGGSGATPQAVLAFVRKTHATARLVDAQPEAVRARIEADLLTLFERHHVDGEGVMFDGAIALVKAKA